MIYTFTCNIWYNIYFTISIIFERYSRSKIKNDTNILIRLLLTVVIELYNTNCLLFCPEKYKPEVDKADRACEVCILTEGLYFEVRITNS